MYYIGYNANFGNYRAGPEGVTFTTEPTTPRLRIGLAHGGENDNVREDVKFDAYLLPPASTRTAMSSPRATTCRRWCPTTGKVSRLQGPLHSLQVRYGQLILDLDAAAVDSVWRLEQLVHPL